MKRIFRQLSIVAMTLITLLGNFKMTMIQAEEVTDTDYGVVGAYNAYSLDKGWYEPGYSDKIANEMIYIRHVGAGANKGSIVYCFNASLSVPDIWPSHFIDEDLVNVSGRFPTYTRTNGQIDNNFFSNAKNPRLGNNTSLVSTIKKVIYNGYRDGAGNRVSDIKKAYKDKYKEDISDAELYAATQKAVWYYTDSTDEYQLENDGRLGKNINKRTLLVYRFLIGKGDHGLGLELQEPPVDKVLDLYNPTEATKKRTNRNYQNLLGTEFVNPATHVQHNKVAVTVRKVYFKEEDGKDYALAGASLQVKQGERVIAKWESSDTTPQTLVLDPGEYVLEELTPPQGYKKAAPITFTVDASGSVSYDGKDKYAATKDSDSEVMMVDQPIPDPIKVSLDINKELINKRTQKPMFSSLKGGEYTFVLQGVSEQVKSVHEKVVNGPYGKVSFKELTFTDPGTYVFKVMEEEGKDPQITYDKEPITVTVEIEESEEHNVLFKKSITYEKGGKKTTDMGLFTNYYSEAPVVVPKHKLTIRKEVTGDIGDKGKYFRFKLSLKDSKGQPISSVKADDGLELVYKDGVYNFNLKHDQYVSLVDLPQGYSYEITEEDAEGYQVTVDDQPSPDAKAVGTDIKADKEVKFVNHKELVPATGVVSDSAPYLYLLSLCLLPLLIWIVKKRVN